MSSSLGGMRIRSKRPRRGCCENPPRGLRHPSPLGPAFTTAAPSFPMSSRTAGLPESLTRLSHPSHPISHPCSLEFQQMANLPATRKVQRKQSQEPRTCAGPARHQKNGAEPPDPEAGPSHCARAVPPSLLAANGTSGPAPGDSGPAPGDAPRRRPRPLAESTARGRPGPRPRGHHEANAKNGPVPSQSFGAAQRAEAQLLVRRPCAGGMRVPPPGAGGGGRAERGACYPKASQVAGPRRGQCLRGGCGPRLTARISLRSRQGTFTNPL